MAGDHAEDIVPRAQADPIDYIPPAPILEQQISERQRDVARLQTLLRFRRELEATGSDSDVGTSPTMEAAPCK